MLPMHTSTTPHGQSPPLRSTFRFNDLPPELRKHIYAHIFNGASIAYGQLIKEDTTVTHRFFTSKTSPHRNILMASRACYREAIDLYRQSVASICLYNSLSTNPRRKSLHKTFSPDTTEIRFINGFDYWCVPLALQLLPSLRKVQVLGERLDFADGESRWVRLERFGERVSWVLEQVLPGSLSGRYAGVKVVGEVQLHLLCDDGGCHGDCDQCDQWVFTLDYGSKVIVACEDDDWVGLDVPTGIVRSLSENN